MERGLRLSSRDGGQRPIAPRSRKGEQLRFSSKYSTSCKNSGDQPVCAVQHFSRFFSCFGAPNPSHAIEYKTLLSSFSNPTITLLPPLFVLLLLIFIQKRPPQHLSRVPKDKDEKEKTIPVGGGFLVLKLFIPPKSHRRYGNRHIRRDRERKCTHLSVSQFPC